MPTSDKAIDRESARESARENSFFLSLSLLFFDSPPLKQPQPRPPHIPLGARLFCRVHPSHPASSLEGNLTWGQSAPLDLPSLPPSERAGLKSTTMTTITATMAARLLVTALFLFAAAFPLASAAKPSSPPVCDSQGPRKDCGECVCVLHPLPFVFFASKF